MGLYATKVPHTSSMLSQYPIANLCGKRFFQSTAVIYKAKDANKQALRNLGMSLQNGIKNKQAKNEDIGIDDMDEEHKDNYKILQNYYDSISHMTTEDLLIQQNLDEGKQFRSFPSEHYLDRKNLIKNLPDEIDIFNTSLSKIEKIYKDLGKLDKDKSVQLKYYKRYLRNYSDPILRILQEFNGISDKFKMLRRNELDKLFLNPNSSLFNDNLFHLPYNVVGFDRSLSGFPLRTGKHRLTDICYPQEFIQDLQQCSPKVKLHKKDLDFVEYNENSISINPDDLIKPSNAKIDKAMNLIYNELDVPKKFILMDDLGQYKILRFNFLNKFNSIVETEINTLKASLQKEIELILSSDNQSTNMLLFNHQFFKNNSFKLCDFLKDTGRGSNGGATTSANMLIISYNVKELNLIPYNYLTDKSTRSRRRLFNHIFKLFLINLTDQIETLIRMKYSNRKQVFVNNLNAKISNIIRFKLLNLFDRVNQLKTIPIDQSVVLKPYYNRSFKRLYNYTKIPGSLHRRSATQFKLVDLEDKLKVIS
ncbi:hypothetical protein CANTEDRAFT_123787 [Yamadazyma tenuis ATCC 10573]|uniref:Uncharacterized protein n=1 Tax=Candida tenuis (strain ATCC 10573 / BCRC 21748 / CBS 615 / JCM 9827 / NBRC 10315 / NRRL Y-1498 / VKM Y-70) TaxID=590646 RepID=G3B6H6_CANTC|nr:uncharacterized protein CANTEDRAFT_123787 [Yamadazyma tenuis ATCC 10573]EGV63469.1 hypothetical protein CANTEDRAFT_123787 [Yamadazyma tenuis ATCC 10573]